MVKHQEFMQRAIEVARNNPRAPFGAVLVDIPSREIVAEGLNRTSLNPIMHGEMDAINNYAAKHLNGWDSLRLYTTAEPCAMCQSAIVWARIPEVVFGTSIGKLVEMGWNQFTLTAMQLVLHAPFASCSVVGGVLSEQCDQLFLQATQENSNRRGSEHSNEEL